MQRFQCDLRLVEDGCPRCIEDVDEPQIADVLAGIAESRHLDKCVDAAFVNTEEAMLENESPIDGLLGPDDVAFMDGEEEADVGQELL
jgi:hypothetical protein